MEIKVGITTSGSPIVRVYADRYEVRGPAGEATVEAKRFYKADGSSFSGWIIRDLLDGEYSDPIPNLVEMLKQLRIWETYRTASDEEA